MHVPVVGDILQAEPVGAESIFEARGYARALPVEIVLGKRVEKRDRRLAHLATFAKDKVERGELADVPTRVRSVEDLLPRSQRISLPKHEPMNNPCLNVGQVPKHPQGMTTSLRGRKYDTVVSHFLDASQDAIPARDQVAAYEINGLHGFVG